MIKYNMSKKEKLKQTRNKDKRKVFTITLPEWTLERHITVLAGSEPFAIKPAWRDDFAIKTNRCNMCGMCCVNPEKTGPWIFGTKEMILHGKRVIICKYAFKSKAPDGRDIVECSAPITPWECIIRCGALNEKNLPKDCSLKYLKPWEKCK